MKRILLASLLMLTACATQTIQAPDSKTDSTVFNAPSTSEKAEFIPHTEEKPMKAYLAMNLPYPPYQALVGQLEKSEGVTLTTRGEAHITVVTPIEYDKVLKKHISIAEIHKIAEEAKIQESSFTPVCIGRGQKELNGKLEKTYYVVIESPALIELRGRIEEVYVKNGGKAQDFVPEKFLPHVTLGFTSRDLHFEDGVVKNRSSCAYQFKE
ncbi:2'-5' RNA ligase family protein [Bdellovibrio sp. HCB337]|uniref:2'-5' RNA ligase family protein n=1 Tax=Bdellovibrio sp. HCB337 TaxID=3394358 RepID=UPI0039A6AAC2